MKTISLVLLAALILPCIISCADDDLGPCSNVMPTCSCGSLLLMDRWGSTLVGENKTYHPDSIQMLNDAEYWNLNFKDSLLTFNYGLLSSDKEYYLRLSSQEVDTIKLKISSKQGECFTIKSISECSYSGARTIIDGNQLVVLKF